MSKSLTPAEDGVRAMHEAVEPGLRAFVERAKPKDRRWLEGQIRMGADLRLLAAQEIDSGRDLDDLLDRAGELFASMAAGLGSTDVDGKRELLGVVAIHRALEILMSGEKPSFHRQGARVTLNGGGRS